MELWEADSQVSIILSEIVNKAVNKRWRVSIGKLSDITGLNDVVVNMTLAEMRSRGIIAMTYPSEKTETTTITLLLNLSTSQYKLCNYVKVNRFTKDMTFLKPIFPKPLMKQLAVLLDDILNDREIKEELLINHQDVMAQVVS